ncbi:M3 family metallopeptidase [Chromobacterium violaceum]|uniref:M3 family metallopeptidase n=1 Tax=Chromobacterium violaceum TaxID=536 RepID=UPI0009DADB82|nr:M3 family metallopeptidase [Chromobacterium violaceum]MBX9269697.1 M3 family metallopeptidase [Chromobacterium violaceum]OQS48617.1 peptidase M3 [Chromobacterium violaceum]OQS52123.1 peptidase M3 [Chromobacterium violaceum]QRO33050.1 M3 family metallopeptidase [Chromobacterium violaceum]QRQ17149.1 M3 family metallopeptidase [Chromobacterium violaceum]
MNANPLLQDWTTPHQLPPFEQIRPEHFEPAFDALFAEHLAEIDALAARAEPADFDNTAAAFDRCGLKLERAQLLLDNLTASETSPDLQEVERRMAPKLAGHRSRVYMHEGFFARLDAVHARRDSLGLSEEQGRLLDLIHRDFVRAGAKLQGDDRRRYADIVSRLAELTTAFSQNVLADESEYALQLGEADLAGLPPFLLDAARAAAEARGLPGWAITLSRSSIVPFLTFSARRELRETAWRAWTGRGEHPERDNRPLARQILALRVEQAGLLGYASFADYAIANRMAGTPAAVHALMDQVWEPAKARFEAEKAMLREEAAKLGEPADIQPWDWFYLAEKVRIARYALDDAEIKPYFGLDNMIAAMFDVAGRLFGLEFAERHDLKLYHPDVRAWDVSRGGKVIGLFLGDNYARQNKRGGAWMHVYRWQARNGGEALPIVVNNNNFAKSGRGQTLLSFDDVRTLFHEFGHGLHGLLSDVEYRLLASPNCPWDYVELPSQLMENWALVPEVLEKHARHAQTGAAIPAELVAKIKAARHFNQGFETVRYAASTLIDLALHERADAEGVDIAAFEAAERERLGIPPAAGMNHRPPHFGHIFSDDAYAAGYYVYMWAEVLEAEAFAAFEEAGDPFDPELADKLYRHIYSAGDAREQRAAFRAFRGRDPQAEAMLKNRGML